MSVPKSKRSEPKCIAVLSAKKLTEYVLLITSNEKIFTPQFKALTDDIIHCAEKNYINCYTANNIYVNSSETFHAREGHQIVAILECKNLLALIQLAHDTFHLSGKRTEYWTRMVIDTQVLIRKWRIANKEKSKYR